MAQAAIFLDRDGTINIDYDYIHTIDEFHFIDGVIETCAEFKKMGFLLVIITNQSGIGKGIFTIDQFNKLTEWMDWSFADRGVELDGIYYCPHAPEQGCNCRKPNPEMICAAASDLDIDLNKSYMVGDKLSDVLAGNAARVKRTVLVRSGQPIGPGTEKMADWIIDSLVDLPDKIKADD